MSCPRRSLLCLCSFFFYLYSSYLIFLILMPPPQNVWTLWNLDPDNRQAFMPTQHLGYYWEPKHWSSCLHDKCFISWAIYPALIWIFKTGSFNELGDQKLGHTAWPATLANFSVSISLHWDYNKYVLGANSYPLVLLIELSPQLLFPALRDNIIIENLFCFALKHLCLYDPKVVWGK